MPGPSVDVLADLDARGLVQEATDREALAERLAAGPVCLYAGFDPSADSLHVGHLFGILVLRRFREAGHTSLALVGGATGMVGDPSGRSEERNLLDPATLAGNRERVGRQLERIGGVELIDNLAWTAGVGLLDFLRDVGKHVTVNQMVAKESVRSRMEGDRGISFTEFSYMLLQAHDYLALHRHWGCELQVGGSDQWGNITLGIDLVRRVAAGTVHGLAWPLLVRADGRKFGKTEAGTVWLAADRTSPYELFQHWMQVPDADVERLLLGLTLLGVPECRSVASGHAQDPGRREGQRRLAREVTTLVHGPAATAAAEAVSRLLFEGALDEAAPAGWQALAAEIPTTDVDARRLEAGMAVVDLLVEAGVVRSSSEGRRVLAQGGIQVNHVPVAADARVLGADLRAGAYLLLRRGRRTYHLVRARRR